MTWAASRDITCAYTQEHKLQETKAQMPLTPCVVPIPVKDAVLWCECKKSPTGLSVLTPGPQLAVLFWVLGTLVGGVRYWEQALRSTAKALLPVWCLLPGVLGSEHAAPTCHCHTGYALSKPKLKEISPSFLSGMWSWTRGGDKYSQVQAGLGGFPRTPSTSSHR